MNREEIFKNLPQTISQEIANVSMHETLINLLQQNRLKNLGLKEKDEISYALGCK